MDRPDIQAALRRNHEEFIATVLSIPAAQRDLSHNNKWTPAQQLEHILRAVRPLVLALGLPKWSLRWRFGAPNRPPRDYDALVKRYNEKLAAGGRAAGRFVPPPVPASAVEGMATDLRKLVDALSRRVDRWPEVDLDRVLLPHPLLGKLTVREMLFFTIHHAEHHRLQVERNRP